MKVVVGFLHRADSLAPQFRRSLTMLLMRDAHTRRRIIGEDDQESSANISAGRCDIVRRFLAHPDRPDWLWMVDSDMTFPPDILDRLLLSADAEERPIMGGLCFGVRPPQRPGGGDMFNETMGCAYEAFPTVYKLDEGEGRPIWWDYPRGQVVRVGSTGAACLLVHRRVLADGRWQQPPHPFPWFRETVASGRPCSEDHFFSLKAQRQLGYPLYVDTAAQCGHVKPLVVDELFYDRSRR